MNSVQLKIALATRGARLDERVRGLLAAVPEFTPGALDLVLPDDVRVRVPIDDGATAPYALVAEAGKTFVVGD